MRSRVAAAEAEAARAAAHILRKGQVKRLDGKDPVGQAQFVASLFGVAA
jgi:hypothetical protein